MPSTMHLIGVDCVLFFVDAIHLVDYETTDLNYEPHDLATYLWCVTKGQFLPGKWDSTF